MKAFKNWLEQFKIRCPFCDGTGKVTKQDPFFGEQWLENCFHCDGEGKFVMKHIESDEVWRAALKWILKDVSKNLYGYGVNKIEEHIRAELKED